MKPIKIAILSLTHGHTRKYFQTLKENPLLDWIAVSVESEFVRDNFLKSGYSVPCYMSDEEMFDAHPEIEAVVMASSNHKHIHQFRECAQRGIHILSMKIPTFNMEEYDEMIELVERTKIICQIELEMHYNPVVNRMKKLFRQNLLGKISCFNATNITLSPVWAFPWQGVPEKSYGKRIPLSPNNHRFRGGALSDHPHIFDMIRWLSYSDFDYLYAEVGRNIRTDIEVEDILLINGKMKNGISFLFDPSWSRHEERLKIPGPGWEIYPKRMEVNFSICGEKGVVMSDCFGPNVYHNGAPNDKYTVQFTYFDEWIGMLDEFIHCIRNRKTPTINIRWHKKTIEAMNACYESISSEKVIYL